ncbi:MAG: hypothetical protein HKL95_08790 [Phycisphaerae bacterium]|nr:hypothetical protein [Phycisphaerae bacterium]
MVRRHLWVSLLTYNLIRRVIATAAAEHHQLPRHLGFTLACQEILASWMLVACDPGVLKRRRHRYPLMTRPRQQLRHELAAA